jgi:hypothetical protein
MGWQRLYELAEIGGASGIDLTRDVVDGGRPRQDREQVLGESAGCGGLTGLMPVAPHWDWIVRTAQQLGSPIGIAAPQSHL